MSSTRLDQQQAFAEKNGWGDAELYPLPADASKRRYIRLVRGDQTCLLMDAPPEFENLPAYIRVAEHLRGLGLRSPEVYVHDIALGLALIEDFGSDTFTRLLDGGAAELPLYQQATEVLITLQRAGETAVDRDAPPHDMDLLLEEAGRFLLWFVPAFRGTKCTAAETQQFKDIWSEALKDIAADRSSFVFRDFHVDNLMVPTGENGTIGLLDFQDALQGCALYDLASLVEDQRRPVSADVKEACIRMYLDAAGLCEQQARQAIALLAAQRHTKVAGLFVRFSVERGLHSYLRHLPHIICRLQATLSDAGLGQMIELLDEIAPGLWRQEEIWAFVKKLNMPKVPEAY